MKKQGMTSFYLEALLLTVVFVAVILVLTGVFGAAGTVSARAGRLNQAVTLASNAAEAVAATESLDEAAALLDEGGNVRTGEDELEADYRSDGTPAAEGDWALRLTVRVDPAAEEDPLRQVSIEVREHGKDEPVYSIRTACRKGAGS